MLLYAWKTKSLRIEGACREILFLIWYSSCEAEERMGENQLTKPVVMPPWFILVKLIAKEEFRGILIHKSFVRVCLQVGGKKTEKEKLLRPQTWSQISCIIAFTWFLSIHNRLHLVVKWSAFNMNNFDFKDVESLGNEKYS